MCAKKKSRKKKKSKSKKKPLKKDPDVWTEEEYEAYLCGLYGLECIIDYTPAGFPIGLPIEDSSFLDDENNEVDEKKSYDDDELPF